MASRVREFHLPMTLVFAGSALLSLLLCSALAMGGVELGLNLSLVGLFIGLLLPGGIEIRNRSGRTRRVLVLDYRLHQFGHAVARGVMRTLNSDKRRWEVTYKGPGSEATHGAIEFQLREIQSAIIEDFDAIVLIPAGSDERLWHGLAIAIKNRAFTVVVDTKPPNRVFRDVGIESPRFVSADYAETGVLVGGMLSEWLLTDPQRKCILWTGPYGSWPGEERSRNVIFELARRNLLDRTVLQPISSWAPDQGRCSHALECIEKLGGKVAVYTADDENAVALHLATLVERPALRRDMYIVGCNGTSDDWGRVPSLDLRAVDGTVDILAEEQGVQAAMLMVKERNGLLHPSERSVYIRPHTILAEAQGKGLGKAEAVTGVSEATGGLLTGSPMMEGPFEPSPAVSGSAS